MSKIEMSEEAKKARREYTREYRRKHPDKVKEWNARFWERQAKKAEEQNNVVGERSNK